MKSRLNDDSLWPESLTTAQAAELDAVAVRNTLNGANLDSSDASRSHPVTVDVTELFNRYRGNYLTFRLSAAASASDANERAWYSRHKNNPPTPARPPQLLLKAKGIDEPFPHLERAVDSVLAERLR